MALVCGIDEAGRGPILGPMVVAGVLLDESIEPELARLGVADSKRFAGAHAVGRRAALANAIRERSVYVTLRVVEPAAIDAGNLGDIERQAAGSIIEELKPPGRILADGRSVFGRLARKYPSLAAEDRADARYLSVAAASIVAKDERDRLLAAILAKYEPEFGPIRGGGYPNELTKAFLAAYRARYGDLPPEARRKWRLGGSAIAPTRSASA